MICLLEDSSSQIRLFPMWKIPMPNSQAQDKNKTHVPMNVLLAVLQLIQISIANLPFILALTQKS